MQLLGDALTVLGSRIGIAWEPSSRSSYLVRHGKHPGIPLEIHAGIKVGDRTVVFPLSKEGELFEFLDQTMTATTMTMGGIDPTTGLHAKLTVRIPFKPRNVAFSTIPTIFIQLEVERLVANFRWSQQSSGIVEGKVFLGFSGAGFDIQNQGNDFTITYNSLVGRPNIEGGCIGYSNSYEESLICSDKLVTLAGNVNGKYIEESFTLNQGIKGAKIATAWCAYDNPTLNVLGDICPFKYTQKFTCIDDVAQWARENGTVVEENSRKVDEIFETHNLGESISHLMAQTLHSWLLNTWWVVRPNGQDWFTVWEGSCYFHSTVDVEYTQGPFYLSVWPELLEMELNEWVYYGKDGTACLGDNGKNTLFLSHDMGVLAGCTRQYYPHDMEVEENVNYLLLAFTHWKRTGNDSVILKHTDFIRKLMDFIVACDTTYNGIPDKGCANTIDDACPAIQFGSEQVYLGVKAMVACQVGELMLEHAGQKSLDKYTEFADRAKFTIESQGWKDDHYVVTLSKTLDGIIHPWTGEVMSGELEGWDAYHIYTVNGLALLDMVGYKSGLCDKRLKKDIESAIPKTVVKYGCRHTSYINQKPVDPLQPGLASSAPKVGWISMNMLRDIAAAYRGVDCFSLADRYWDWQCTTNSQEVKVFFETFYGNNLNFYPRGIAVFGYFDAAAGFAYDVVNGTKSFSPVRGSITVPILLFADWDKGTVPKVTAWLEDGRIEYKYDNQ